MPPPSRSISTDSFPPETRAAMWNELVARKLLRIQWDVPDGAEFKATMAPVLCAGDVEIVSMALGPFDLANTLEHSKQKEHRLSLHILTGGHNVTTERAGGATDVRKTMGVLLDEGAFYRQRSANELTRAFVLMLPKARLIDAVPRLPDLMATPLDLSCESFSVLQSYLAVQRRGRHQRPGAGAAQRRLRSRLGCADVSGARRGLRRGAATRAARDALCDHLVGDRAQSRRPEA